MEEMHKEGVVDFVNGSVHSKRGLLGQESDDYKRWHLESKRDPFISSLKHCILYLIHFRVFLELLLGSSTE
jgi:hypothetical protein